MTSIFKELPEKTDGNVILNCVQIIQIQIWQKMLRGCNRTIKIKAHLSLQDLKNYFFRIWQRSSQMCGQFYPMHWKGKMTPMYTEIPWRNNDIKYIFNVFFKELNYST